MRSALLGLALIALTGCGGPAEVDWSYERDAVHANCDSEVLDAAPFKVTETSRYWRTSAGVEYEDGFGIHCDGETETTLGVTKVYDAATQTWHVQ